MAKSRLFEPFGSRPTHHEYTYESKTWGDPELVCSSLTILVSTSWPACQHPRWKLCTVKTFYSFNSNQRFGLFFSWPAQVWPPTQESHWALLRFGKAMLILRVIHSDLSRSFNSTPHEICFSRGPMTMTGVCQEEKTTLRKSSFLCVRSSSLSSTHFSPTCSATPASHSVIAGEAFCFQLTSLVADNMWESRVTKW